MDDYRTNLDYVDRYRQDDYGSLYYDDASRRDATRRYDDERGQREWSLVSAGVVMVLAGAWLLYQGGRSRPARVFSLPGGDERGRAPHARPGIQVDESVTVHADRDELYRYWRRLENLPHVMSHLKEVTSLGANRSHWVAQGPVGTSIDWNAQITDDRTGELIAWRSLEDSTVPNEGSVHFGDQGGGATEIRVRLTYHPPLGPLGAAVANLFHRAPAQQIRDDLEAFKTKVASGELSLTENSSL